MNRGEFEVALGEAETPWAATLALLAYLRARPSDGRPARDGYGDPYSAWTALELEVCSYFARRLSSGLQLSDDDRAQILAWIGPEFDRDRIDAIAYGIDEAGYTSFPSSWRDTLALKDGCYTLSQGDAYPVGQIQRSDVPGVSVVPHAATDPSEGELPHLRFFESPKSKWVDEVVLDCNLWNRLEGLFSSLTGLATIHPNESVTEWSSASGSSLFPVQLQADDQPARLRRLVEHLAQSDLQADVLVAPELAAPPEAVETVQRHLNERDSDALVVAGSQHLEDAGKRRNRAFGLLPNRPALTHDKIVPYRRWHHALRRQQIEGIDGNTRLRIYQAGRFRLALLICKDFLDRDIQDLLVRLGVNLLVVPSMSAKTHRFVAAAQRLAFDAQSISVVANGPFHWRGNQARPAAVFGQPIETNPCISGQPSGGCCTGCYWIELGTNHTEPIWVPVAL